MALDVDVKTLLNVKVEDKSSKKKAYSKPDVSFEGEGSFCDIFITKTMKTKQMKCVLFLSQKKYFILDNYGTDKQKGFALTEDNLCSFFRSGVSSGDIPVPGCNWLTELNPSSDGLRFIWDAINNDEFLKAAKMGAAKICYTDRGWCHGVNSDMVEICANHQNIIKRIIKLTPHWLESEEGIGRILALCAIQDIYGDINAAYIWYEDMLGSRLVLDAKPMYGRMSMVLDDSVKEAIAAGDPSRMSKYVQYDLFRQGFSTASLSGANTALATYADYMRIQKEYYGFYKDKYPAHLRDAHDTLYRNYDMKHDVGEMAKIDEIARDAEEKGLTGTFGNFIFFAPHTVMDLIDDAEKLDHCGGTYGKLVENGNCRVFFMHRKDRPDEAYMTIELLANGNLRYTEAAYHRQTLTKEEHDAILKWAKKNADSVLSLTSQNTNFTEDDERALQKAREKKAAGEEEESDEPVTDVA